MLIYLWQESYIVHKIEFNKYISWQSISGEIEKLSQDERAVLINYINIYMAYQKWDSDNAWAMAQNLLINSVSWGSQIIALELNW